MNEYIKNLITDFLTNEDDCALFDEICDDDKNKRKLLREYSYKLASYCKYGKDYD